MATPKAEPYIPDEMAIVRAVAGNPPSYLHVQERRAAIAALDETGHTALEIAERLRCTTRTVQRHRAHLRAADC
jgi:DNA-binding NarL/FixJ family response regulator